VDVRSPSAPSPILNRQQGNDLVSTDEPPVAERHHANVGGSDIYFLHVHIVANVCSTRANRPLRIPRVPTQPTKPSAPPPTGAPACQILTAMRTYVRLRVRLTVTEDDPERPGIVLSSEP
jgi:hypothetical protein